MAPVTDRRHAIRADRPGSRTDHAGLLGLVLAICARVESWIDRARERRGLAQLTDRELRDIGISRYEAEQEWRKPFWRP